jgi:hypothetical protein
MFIAEKVMDKTHHVGVKMIRDSEATKNVSDVLGKSGVMSIAQVVKGRAVDEKVMVVFQCKATKAASVKPVSETRGKGITGGQLMRASVELDHC